MRFGVLFLVPLLAACDTTGPDPNWDYEGVIESGNHAVADVGSHATITCQVDRQAVTVWTGDGATGPHCLKRYSEVQVGEIIRPTYTLYVRDARVGAAYRARVR